MGDRENCGKGTKYQQREPGFLAELFTISENRGFCQGV
jgi:hypothetical protein